MNAQDLLKFVFDNGLVADLIARIAINFLSL